MAAMAGRDIPSIGRRQKVAIAINAPVLPPEMATSASTSLTDCSAAHIEELPLPLRRAWEGFSSIEMTLSQWTTRLTGLSSGNLSSSGVMSASRPWKMKLTFLRSRRASQAPWIATWGPTSPPMASTEMRMESTM